MSQTSINGASVTRFADIEILRYYITRFGDLPLDQKLLVYHLSEAALWGRDIIFDQNGRYGLRLRNLFEGIYQYYQGDRSSPSWQAVETYLYRLWFSSGIHHHYGSEKFVPGFQEAYLRELISSVQQSSGMLLEYDPNELDELCWAIFSPDYYQKRTEQTGDGDLLEASSANFYDLGVRMEEANAYYQLMAEQASPEEQKAPPSYGLNSRLARADGGGALYEQTYKVGGLYGEALERIIAHLKAAMAYVRTPLQREAILALINYYKTGDLNEYNRYCISWVKDTEANIDFINGFTEVYTDPLGLKGSWESLVHIRDEVSSERTRKICAEARWFEQNAPIDERFKKPNPVGVSASVVTVAMLSGDSYPATPIGINLPNADWIRADYGSKSVTIENIHDAYRRASMHSGMDEAFVPDPQVRELLRAYDGLTDELHTDLHECLGHGSGQLLPGVSPDALGPYGSTIEEARADLFALYYMADPKLVEMELLPDDRAYQACYYRYLLNGLVTQLVRIQPGNRIEEAHMRNRALIARYLLAEAGTEAIELRGIELRIYDYPALRRAVAKLLAEIQRIKSEGDLPAAKALVEQYAVEIDPEMHAQILSRYAQLDIAPYRGFVNPRLSLVYQDDALADVTVDYTEGYAEQMLRYSREYGVLSPDPTTAERMRQPQPSAQTLETAQTLRASLRHSMDGMVANSMRQKGLFYAYNFGLTQEYIHRLASRQPASEDLARYILSRDVRELKLIGQIIYPAEAVSHEVALSLSRSSFANPELRDCLCKSLFDRCPYADRWSLSWIFAPEEKRWVDILPIAYITLARKISQGLRIENEVWRGKLLANAFAELREVELEYITPVQNAVLLLLKRWGRTDTKIREYILHSAEFVSWEESDSALLREFYADLHFDLSEPSALGGRLVSW